MKIAVCTANIGAHDPLRDPSLVVPGVRYLCATDRDLDSGVWRPVRIRRDLGTDVMQARRFKILLHEYVDADLTVWIDAAFELHVDPHIFVRPALRHDLLVMPHPFCATLQDEATACGRKLIAKDTADRQVAAYLDAGFPKAHPHSSTGLLVRRSDHRTRLFNAAWWREMERFGHPRDQMSFDFVTWRHRMSVGQLEGQYRDNPYATWDDGSGSCRR